MRHNNGLFDLKLVLTLGLVIFIVMGSVQNLAHAKKNSFPYTVPLSPSYEDFYNTVTPFLGKCVVTSYHKLYPRFDAFEKTVVPYWNRTLDGSDQGDQLVRFIESYNLRPSDLVGIDALARTLYAEMDLGFDYGLHYARAIAGVILNRAEAIDSRRKGFQSFSRGQHKKRHVLKNTITQVVTAKRQFSAWDGMIGKRFNPVLSHALCPPINKSTPFWKHYAPQYRDLPKWSKLPSKNEIQHWNLAVRIAIEAVLQPDRFWANFSVYNKKGGIISGREAFPIYYYTSGYYKNGVNAGRRVTLFKSRRDGSYKVVSGPSIAGRADYNERLLRFWAPRKKTIN